MKHWFSSETIHLIRVKRRIYHQIKQFGTDLLKRKYNAISNLVRSQTRKDTAAHVSNLSSSYFVNSKKLWNFLNSVNCHPVPPLKHNGTLISDDYDKASIFNRYFHSVFTVEHCDIISNVCQSLEYHPNLYQLFCGGGSYGTPEPSEREGLWSRPYFSFPIAERC